MSFCSFVRGGESFRINIVVPRGDARSVLAAIGRSEWQAEVQLLARALQNVCCSGGLIRLEPHKQFTIPTLHPLTTPALCPCSPSFSRCSSPPPRCPSPPSLPSPSSLSFSSFLPSSSSSLPSSPLPTPSPPSSASIKAQSAFFPTVEVQRVRSVSVVAQLVHVNASLRDEPLDELGPVEHG